MTLQLNCPPYFDLSKTVLSHGWVNLEPYSFDRESGSLSRIDSFLGKTYLINISQNDRRIDVNIIPDPKAQKAITYFSSLTEYCLFFDLNIDSFLRSSKTIPKKVINAIKEGYGYFLRGGSYFEDCVKTLLTTNCNWSHTQNMVRSLCKKYGTNYVSKRYTFPDLAKLKRVSEKEFKRIGLGYRAGFLTSLCKHFNPNSDPKTWKGFGEYSSSHLKFLSGDFQDIPVDREVCSYFGITYDYDSFKKVNKKFAKWGNYKFIVYKIERRLNDRNWIGD